ncbi:MAG: hypothetical protein UR28_C0021G0002 [Candidatus Peregrinibacteria bacterium GW2011_GWF2_33_10]|nr:MAG: hypothetical protein UR28_C0021G0002 [Candidatus Peregrinibacteria bacterium GW2011_GWF2_33_10]
MGQMFFHNIKTWIKNKFSFGEKRRLFANTAGEGGQGARENLERLTKAERIIWEILQTKGTRNQEEQYVYEQLEQKQHAEANLTYIHNPIVKDYCLCLLHKIEHKEGLAEYEKIFLRDNEEEIQNLRLQKGQNENFGLKDEEIRTLYANVVEEEKGAAYRINRTILASRNKMYALLANETEKIEDSTKLGIRSIFDLVKDKKLMNRMSKEKLATEEEMTAKWEEIEKQIADFIHKFLPQEQTRFIQYLKSFPHDVQDSEKKKKFLSGDMPHGTEAFPYALTQYFLDFNPVYSGDEDKIGKAYKNLLKKYEIHSNLSNIREALRLHNLQFNSENLDRKKRNLATAAEQARRYFEEKTKDQAQGVIHLDDPQVQAFIDKQQLGPTVKKILAAKETGQNTKTITIEELTAMQTQLEGQMKDSEITRVEAAQGREAASAKLGVMGRLMSVKNLLVNQPSKKNDHGEIIAKDKSSKTIYHKIKIWADKQAKKKNDIRSKTKLEEHKQQLRSDIEDVKGSKKLLEGLTSSIGNFDNYFLFTEGVYDTRFHSNMVDVRFQGEKLINAVNQYINIQEPGAQNYLRNIILPEIKEQVASWEEKINRIKGSSLSINAKSHFQTEYTKFKDKLKPSTHPGLLKELSERFPGQEGEENEFVTIFDKAFEAAITTPDEGKPDEVFFDSQKFLNPLKEYILTLPKDLRTYADDVQTADKSMEKINEERSEISKQLMAIQQLRDNFAETEDQKSFNYLQKLQDELKSLDDNPDPSEEGQLAKLMRTETMVRQHGDLFAKMGIDIERNLEEGTVAQIISQRNQASEEQLKQTVKDYKQALGQNMPTYPPRAVNPETFLLPESIHCKAVEGQCRVYPQTSAIIDRIKNANQTHFRVISRQTAMTIPEIKTELEKRSDGTIKGFDTIDCHRNQSNSSKIQPMGIQVTYGEDPNKQYAIYVFDDFQKQLQIRNIGNNKEAVDHVLASFLREEHIHSIQETKGKTLSQWLQKFQSHQAEWNDIVTNFQNFYGYSNRPEDRNVLKEILAQITIADGRNFSKAYQPMVDTVNNIAHQEGINLDLLSDKVTSRTEMEMGIQEVSAQHDIGANGLNIFGDNNETSTSQETENEENVAKKKNDMIEEIGRITQSPDKESSDGHGGEIKPHYLNIENLKKRIKQADVDYDFQMLNDAQNDLEELKNALNLFNTNTDNAKNDFKPLEQRYKAIKTDYLEKLEKHLKEAEAVSAPSVSFLQDLWNNTRFLSIHSCGTIIKEAWGHFKEEHETNENFKSHLVGHHIGGATAYGSKQKAKKQSDEQHKVHEWVEMFKGISEVEIDELMYNCTDEFQLKALLEHKANTIGDLSFGDKAVWRGIERTLGKRIYSRRQAEYAIDERYGKNTALELNKSAKAKYNGKANEFKELVRAQQNQMDIWNEMVEHVEHAKLAKQRKPWVDSMHYDAAFRYSIDDGKSTPQKAFYYLFKGYSLGILTPEAMEELQQSKLNDFPPIENLGKVLEEHEKGIVFKPPKRIAAMMDKLGYHYHTELDFISALKPFKNHGSPTDPDYLIWEWWLAGERFGESDKAAERLNKAFSRAKASADPDWSEEMLWHLSERDFKTALEKTGSMSADKISSNCMANSYKTLIYYASVQNDNIFEKMLKKFVTIDRYVFEDSYKSDKGNITIDQSGGPVKDRPSAPGYWKTDLDVKSVMPPSTAFGTYRYVLFKGMQAYAQGGLSAARKEIIRYGMALGVYNDNSETKDFLATQWGADYQNILTRSGEKEILSGEIMTKYKDMPLTHLNKFEGKALADWMGGNEKYKSLIGSASSSKTTA